MQDDSTPLVINFLFHINGQFSVFEVLICIEGLENHSFILVKRPAKISVASGLISKYLLNIIA